MLKPTFAPGSERATPAISDDNLLPFSFPAVQRKKITAAFDGGRIMSDGGVMLLAQAEPRLGIAERLAQVIPDRRDQDRVTHLLPDIHPAVRAADYIAGVNAAPACRRKPAIFVLHRPVRGKGSTMKQLVGFAGVLLAASTAARQRGPIVMPAQEVIVGHNGAAGPICETRRRQRPAPELEVKITPSEVKIPDNAKRGTPLAKVTVRWNNGEPFRGELRLTKNTAGICQLSGMELQLSRDVTKADDYKRSLCTVTAIK